MKILISGSTGLIGSSLLPCLHTRGHDVTRLVRRLPEPGGIEVHWNPARGELASSDLEGLDAVVHLAGENIASGRWTPEKKVRIRESRVQGTRLLAKALSEVSRRPSVFVSTSATGYYGHRGEEILTEDSPPGSGFMAEVCRQWEEATRAAAGAGIRVVILRFGVVLTPRGGMLAKMLMPFRLGLGGKIGTGRQYMSWISMDDLVGVILHALAADSLKGVVNAVSPDPVTNLEFTRALGRVLRRPAFLSVPAPAVRLLLGEMADELLLASQRVEPSRLKTSGYRFKHPDLESALRHLLDASQSNP